MEQSDKERDFQYSAARHLKWVTCYHAKATRSPETSVINYHYSLGNNPEERSFRGGTGNNAKCFFLATLSIK
jgi:hypothetical protein